MALLPSVQKYVSLIICLIFANPLFHSHCCTAVSGQSSISLQPNAKWIKQRLLFLVHNDEKMLQTSWKKTLHWKGRQRVSECVINKLICLSEQFRTQRNMNRGETRAKRERLVQLLKQEEWKDGGCSSLLSSLCATVLLFYAMRSHLLLHLSSPCLHLHAIILLNSCGRLVSAVARE